MNSSFLQVAGLVVGICWYLVIILLVVWGYRTVSRINLKLELLEKQIKLLNITLEDEKPENKNLEKEKPEEKNADETKDHS